MKTIKYLTHLKIILLFGSAGLYLANPTMLHAGDKKKLSVGFVSSRHLDYRAETPQGYLTVYSATDRFEDGELQYYAHSPYAIYTIGGKLFKRVENHLSATDEAPEMVSLPIGSYIVEARSEKGGYIRTPVAINESRRTILNPDLE
jgi:hypothetical protein